MSTPDAMLETAGDGGLDGRLLGLVRALRRANVPVAVSDGLDATRALGVVDLLDRPQVRESLAATLLSSPGHRPVFDRLFDVWFPARVGDAIDVDAGDRDVGDYLAELADEVRAGDEAALRRLAREAVQRFGGVEQRDGSTAYFAYRVWRHINPDGVLRRVSAADRDLEAVEARLRRDEHRARLRRFREEVDAEVRRRTAERRGAEEVGRHLAGPLPEDVDFFHVTADEHTAMRQAVRTLSRRLAARLALRRRRAREGRLDPRRTMRSALSTGGVPAEPVFRTRRRHRPELVLLCDVSGSVAAFAKFTMLFCHALTDQFSKVRSFAFIDTVDEVTELFEGTDAEQAMRRVTTEAKVVWLDGHSDYGHALEVFAAEHPDALGPRTTLLVLGDARSNYRSSGAATLAQLRKRARRTYWLNPEPTAAWGSGDSVAGEYARHVDRMVECRNLRQLAAFVESLA